MGVTHTDAKSSFFWLVLSILVFVGSIRLGIGTPTQPGAGFIAFGASGLLGVLSISLFFRSKSKKKEAAEHLFTGTLWWRVVATGLAILIYAWQMPRLGYLITTFLLMFFLYWLVPGQKWRGILFYSLVATLGSYYIFSKLLNCQFPDGLLGF